jgi:hypothetical protein
MGITRIRCRRETFSSTAITGLKIRCPKGRAVRLKPSAPLTLSDAVLRALSHTGIVEVNGLGNKGPDEFLSVPIAAFKSKVLCERHNAALSPLDAIGLRFFKSFSTLNAELRDKLKKPRNRGYRMLK